MNPILTLPEAPLFIADEITLPPFDFSLAPKSPGAPADVSLEIETRAQERALER